MMPGSQAPEPGAPAEKEQYDAYVGQIARGAGITSIGQGVGRVLGYATQVAIAQLGGPTQLGFYVLGMSLVALSNVLSMLGMNDGAVRYVSRYRAEGDVSRVRGTILTVLLVPFALSLVFSALLFFGAGFIANVVYGESFLETVLRAFSPSIPFFTLMGMALWATEGFHTVKYTAYVKQILRPLIGLGLVVLFYLLGVQVLGAVAAFGLSTVAGAALALYYLRRLFPDLFDRTAPAKYETRELFRVSGPMAVNSLTTYTDLWAMTAVLGIFASAREVGIYNVANRTAILTGLALFAFSGIFSPMISALHRQGSMDQLGRLYKDVARWNFTGSLAIFTLTALLSRDILAVFGEGFVRAWPALILISGAQLFSASVGLTGRVLVMTGHQTLVMWTRLGAAVASIAGGVALAPSYGILGAAVGTATGIVLVNAATLFFVERRLGFWPYGFEYLKPVTAALLAAGATALAKEFLPVPGGLPALAVFSVVFGAVFAGTIVALRLNDSDRRFLQAFWRAVRRNVVAVGRGA